MAEPSRAQIHEFILSQFVTLWEEYARARTMIPEGNLAELSYDELAADPVGAVHGGHFHIGRRALSHRAAGTFTHMA